MKALIIAALALSSSAAFAKMEAGTYEICKGSARGGDTITLTGNYANGDTIEINANGQRLVYNAGPTDSCGDVEECYESADHGGLKVTFYDEDNSASGWSKDLGAFKLKCTQNK